ncbi:MAG: DUF3887 domain-containing protein [Candidatus Omnitrophota bacterium]
MFNDITGMAEVIGTTDKGVQAIAETVLDNILAGIKTDDYSVFSMDFDDTLKETIDEEKFLEMNKQIKSTIGNFSQKEYLGFLTKGKMTVIYWKARFDKSSDDVLIQLVISKRGEKYLVTGLWFN